jgi:hypothetical protein
MRTLGANSEVIAMADRLTGAARKSAIMKLKDWSEVKGRDVISRVLGASLASISARIFGGSSTPPNVRLMLADLADSLSS